MINYIIRKAERFFRVDIRYILTSSSWIAAGKIFASLIAFALSIAYARYLPKAVYGDYRYILSVLSVAGIFAVPGVGVAMARSVARGFEGTFRRGGKIIFLASFGISIVGIGCAIYFFYAGNIFLAWGFIITSIFIPLVEGLGNWRNYYDGKKAFKVKTILNTIDQLSYGFFMLLGVGIIYVFELSTGPSLLVLLIAYSLGEGLTNAFFFVQTLKKIPRNAAQEPGALRYGLHLSLANIPATIANYIDTILLYTFTGPATVAIYSFAIALPEQIKAYLGIVADISFPKLAQTTQDTRALAHLKKTLIRKTIRASIVTLGIVVVYIIAAPLIYKIFFPRYVESVLYSQVFALSLVLFPFGIFNTALKAEGNVKKVYVYNIIAPIVQITALIIFVPVYGLWGAIIGRIFGRIINLLLPLFFFR